MNLHGIEILVEMKAENLLSFCRMLENSWRGEDLHPELGHEDGVLGLSGPGQGSI